MLLFTAIKELKRHIIMNIVTFLELTVAVILVSIMVSTVLIRYKYYEPFKDIYSSKGIYCEFSLAGINGAQTLEMEELLCDDDILPLLSSPQMLASSNRVMGFPTINGETVPSSCISYNDELISRYTPETVGGEWFDLKKTGGTLEAVVSKNEYGWKTGDVVKVHFACKDYNGELDVKIIGELKNGTKIPGIVSDHSGENNANMFFYSYDYENEGVPLLIFSTSQLREKKVFQSLSFALLKYPENTSDEVLSEDQKKIASYGGVFSMKNDMVNQNSIDYFKTEVLNYLPIIVVVLIMTCVSSISITALSTRQRLKDYGIYYICGLKWRSCCAVNLFYSVIISLLSAVCAALLIVFAPYIPKLNQVTILANIWIMLSVLAVIALFIITSMIMPLIIIGKNTPKEILAKGDS